jgi:hypothetical protein
MIPEALAEDYAEPRYAPLEQQDRQIYSIDHHRFTEALSERTERRHAIVERLRRDYCDGPFD